MKKIAARFCSFSLALELAEPVLRDRIEVIFLRDPRWLAVKVLVEKDTVQQAMDELERIGCTAILETELRHTRL